MNELRYGIYTHNGILLGNKKEWNNAICSYTDGSTDYHTKWSHKEKDKNHVSLYMWNFKYDTGNLSMKQKDSQT